MSLEDDADVLLGSGSNDIGDDVVGNDPVEVIPEDELLESDGEKEEAGDELVVPVSSSVGDVAEEGTSDKLEAEKDSIFNEIINEDVDVASKQGSESLEDKSENSDDDVEFINESGSGKNRDVKEDSVEIFEVEDSVEMLNESGDKEQDIANSLRACFDTANSESSPRTATPESSSHLQQDSSQDSIDVDEGKSISQLKQIVCSDKKNSKSSHQEYNEDEEIVVLDTISKTPSTSKLFDKIREQPLDVERLKQSTDFLYGPNKYALVRKLIIADDHENEKNKLKSTIKSLQLKLSLMSKTNRVAGLSTQHQPPRARPRKTPIPPHRKNGTGVPNVAAPVVYQYNVIPRYEPQNGQGPSQAASPYHIPSHIQNNMVVDSSRRNELKKKSPSKEFQARQAARMVFNNNMPGVPASNKRKSQDVMNMSYPGESKPKRQQPEISKTVTTGHDKSFITTIIDDVEDHSKLTCYVPNVEGNLYCDTMPSPEMPRAFTKRGASPLVSLQITTSEKDFQNTYQIWGVMHIESPLPEKTRMSLFIYMERCKKLVKEPHKWHVTSSHDLQSKNKKKFKIWFHKDQRFNVGEKIYIFAHLKSMETSNIAYNSPVKEMFIGPLI